MRRILTSVLIAIAMLVLLPACSSEEPLDAEAVEVELDSRQQSGAGSPMDLKATITGLQAWDKVTVTFDIRVGGRAKLIDADHEGNGVFSSSYTFPEKGKYIVYIHVYADDLHVTKRKTVMAN